MMAVNVNVEDALVGLKQLEDTQHAVVYKAEPARLELLCVMEATRPVDGHVCVARGQLGRGYDRSSRISLAVVVHMVEDGAVATLRGEAELGDLVGILVLLVHRYSFETINIFVAMEGCQVCSLYKVLVNTEQVHLLVHFVAADEGVRHLYSEGLDRMSVRNLIDGEIFVVVVADLLLASRV
jgi:hypothetical protein